MNRFKSFLLLLTLVGFMWGCETTDPFVNDVQIGLVAGDYELAMEAVDEALEENPDNSVAHYYKGIVLGNQAADTEDPSERKDLYAQARESFMTSKELMEAEEERPSEYEEIDTSMTAFWAEEYNTAVNILTDDSTRNATENPNETSIIHLDNAATINPDSARTFQVMSSAYFNNNDVENAISSYEKAMALLDNPEIEDYEYIISLYLSEGPAEKAIEYSEQAREDFPDESVFVQFLADGYIQSGERDRGIAIVQELIDEDPENAQYRRVLGTQIYQTVDELNSRASDLYEEQYDLRQQSRNMSGSELEDAESQIEELQAEIDEIETDIDELVEIASTEMKTVVELEPNDEEANFILGIIYQNHAANLFERRNNTTENDVAQEFDQEARENLQEALVYYERAAELNPDNPEYWQSLFQVYTTLGMEEEAEEAMERAGDI